MGRDRVSFHFEAPLPTQDLVCTTQCSEMLELAVWTREGSSECREGDVPRSNTDIKDTVSLEVGEDVTEE